MTEALGAFPDFGKALGVKTVRADTLCENIKSQAVFFAPLSVKVRGMNLYSIPLTFTKIDCKIRRLEYCVSKHRYLEQISGKANAVVYKYEK